MIKISRQRAFSVIEMLVVVFVILLLTSLILVNYRSGQKKYNLTQSIQRLSADLRQAQNLSLAIKNEAGGTPAGYGIHTLSATQYALFYNINQGLRAYSAGASQILRTITLSSGVTISPSSQSIYFMSPDPTTYINGVNSGSQALILTSGSFNQTITVNASGRIDTQ